MDPYLGVIIIDVEVTRFAAKINGAEIFVPDDELALAWQRVDATIIDAGLLFHTADQPILTFEFSISDETQTNTHSSRALQPLSLTISQHFFKERHASVLATGYSCQFE
jgi:hypothetical protein